MTIRELKQLCFGDVSYTVELAVFEEDYERMKETVLVTLLYNADFCGGRAGGGIHSGNFAALKCMAFSRVLCNKVKISFILV